jgi:hypothetical protein
MDCGGQGDSVWLVTNAHTIWHRTGITETLPEGSDWEMVPGGMKWISVNEAYHVWGVDASDSIFTRVGTSP